MDFDEGIPINDIVPWEHQKYAVDEVIKSIVSGVKRICVTSPTGGGKTWMIAKIAMAMLAEGKGVTLFCNRKLLIEQMQRALNDYGIEHGVRNATHGRNFRDFQVASIQTEYSRVVKRQTWEPHDSGMIIVDEAHINENPSSHEVFNQYLDMGCVKVGFTATPLGLDGCYDQLIQAGTNSELRACGALVPAIQFGCTEPDLSNIKRIKVGEDLTDPQNVKAIMVPGIHGRVLEHFQRLNPRGLPTIGFAPGVPESRGFAEAFQEAGIDAAHICGDYIWIKGQEYPATQEIRNALLQMSRSGEVRIVWNRFVLREAVDMPWLRHGILATVFGSLQSNLQSTGRLLRACRAVGKKFVTIQDHGGNWWRHGDINDDRHWRLRDTNQILANERADRLAGDTENEPKEQEPFLCPRCGAAIVLPRTLIGSRCQCRNCGYEFEFRKMSRPVLQANGELVRYDDKIFKKKKVERRKDTAAKWKAMYWRAKNSKSMTFAQAAGLFCHTEGYYPPRTLPLMPIDNYDWYLKVADVPFDRLYKEGE